MRANTVERETRPPVLVGIDSARTATSMMTLPRIWTAKVEKNLAECLRVPVDAFDHLPQEYGCCGKAYPAIRAWRARSDRRALVAFHPTWPLV